MVSKLENLPPYVQAQKRGSGKMRYYYQRHRNTPKAGPRIRLPDDPTSFEFMEAYEAANNNYPCPLKPYTKVQRGLDVVVLLRGAKQRAKEQAVPFDLTEEFILAMMTEQKMLCAVTGIKMKPRATGEAFAWSIDRIHGPTGYVTGNVRLVCRITNMAMNHWGEETLLQFIQLAYKSGGRKATVTLSGNKKPLLTASP